MFLFLISSCTLRNNETKGNFKFSETIYTDLYVNNNVVSFSNDELKSIYKILDNQTYTNDDLSKEIKSASIEVLPI